MTRGQRHGAGARQGALTLGLTVLMAGVAPPALQQATQPGTAIASSRPQFTGSTQAGVGGRVDSVRVDIRLWSISGRGQINALELPLRGLLIVDVRGGEITTVIDGRRQERKAGEIFSVPAGSTMRIETGQDMVSLQTTVIGN